MFFPALSNATLPDPEAIRRTAEEVVRQPEYQLGPTRDDSALVDWLLQLLEPLVELFRGLSKISPVLAWTVIVSLVIILLALVAHIIYTFKQALSGPKRSPNLGPLERKSLDPREFEAKSQAAAARQDYIEGVRLLFLAALIRLEQRNQRQLRPGMTNRDYLRRYRDSNVFEALQQFVQVIDAKWYGHGICNAEDYDRCCQAHATIRTASEVRHANAA